MTDKTIRGGLLQYAHEPSDLDDAILQLRERLAVDFLEPLLIKLQEKPSAELGLCIVYIFQLVYPDSIAIQQSKDYELKHSKKFVPDRFIQDIPLFGRSSILLREGLDVAWPEHTAIMHTSLPTLALQDLSEDLFPDQPRRKASGVLVQYALSRHSYVQKLAGQQQDPVEAALPFVIRQIKDLQTEEILNLYFEQLLGTEVLRTFYSNNKLDAYADDYKLVTLPVEQDPFLRELNIFIQNADQFNPDQKEEFLDFLDVKQVYEIDMDNIPESLQQQMILQAFNSRTLLSQGLLQYGMLVGHQNARLGFPEIDTEFNLIKASSRQLPGEPVLDIADPDLTIGACEDFLMQSALTAIRGIRHQ